MSAEINIAGIQIPQSDWDATPESVKAVVTVLNERLAYPFSVSLRNKRVRKNEI